MNRFTIAILCACLLAFATAENECRIFSCGNIQQSGEGPDICAQPITENEGENFRIQNCKDAFCQAIAWTNPGEAAEATCGATIPAPLWPNYTPADGKALDGDRCEKTEHCMTSAKNAATCNTDNNVCVSALKKDDACDATTDCPVGHRCAGDPLVCTPLLGSGATCTSNDECERMMECVSLGDAEELKLTCQQAGSIANGDKFRRPTATEANAELAAALVCESGLAITTDNVVQCRQATTNKDQNLPRPAAGTDCVLLEFDNDDMEKFSEPTEKTGVVASMCGFNKDSNSHCVPQPGDDNIREWRKKAAQQTANNKCHKLSGGEGSFCNDFYNWQISSDGWKFFTNAGLVGTASAQAYANVANNDKCVAESVNLNFWSGHFGDNAFGLSVAAISAAALSFVF